MPLITLICQNSYFPSIMGAGRDSPQPPLPHEAGSLGGSPPGLETQAPGPVPCGSDLRLAALNQLQVWVTSQAKWKTPDICMGARALPAPGLIWTPQHVTSECMEVAPLHPHGFGELLARGRTFPGHQWNSRSLGEGEEGQEQAGLDGTEKRTAVEEKERGKRKEAKRQYQEEKGRQPKSSWSQSPQQRLDHFPARSHLIFAPYRRSSGCLPITLEQAENVVGLALLFLLLAPREVCNQLLMALPSRNSFLSPVIVITRSPAFVLPSLSQHLGSSATAKAPRAQRAGETSVKHIQEYLKVSAAYPLQRFQHGIKSFVTRRRLYVHKWQSWDGVLYRADRQGTCCQLPHHCKVCGAKTPTAG